MSLQTSDVPVGEPTVRTRGGRRPSQTCGVLGWLLRSYSPLVVTGPAAGAVERVERLTKRATDTLVLRMHVLEELRRAVPFDAYAWLLTDPETEVGTSPLADVPWFDQLSRHILLKYLTPLNRWTALLDRPVALLHEAAEGDLGQSRLWRELLRERGVVDAASVVLRDRFGCWGFLELWRLAPSGTFSTADRELLASVAPALTAGVRRLQAETLVQAPQPGQPAGGPVVLVLSCGLEVHSMTAQTQQYLRVLVPPDSDHPPVPASAYNVAAQLLAAEAGVDDHPAWARVHLRDGVWVTLRAARLSADDLAVTIERTTPAERIDLFCRAFGLSPRERDVLVSLAGGSDTRHVAASLFVSEHTIQDHLKSIFGKTSLRSRRELLSAAIGT